MSSAGRMQLGTQAHRETCSANEVVRLCLLTVGMLLWGVGEAFSLEPGPVGLYPNEDWTSGFYRANFFADVTGDGRADAIDVTQFKVFVGISLGTRMAPSSEWATNMPAEEFGSAYFGDVNGDQRADLIRNGPGGSIQVWLSDGGRFQDPHVWHGPLSLESRFSYVADVTGDGRADFITLEVGAIAVRRSTGSSFAARELWLGAPFFGDVNDRNRNYFIDMDGDRIADAVAITPENILVRKARPGDRRFGAPVGYITATDEEPHLGSLSTTLADMDGDLRADLVLVNEYLSLWIRRNPGGRFLPIEPATKEPFREVPFYGEIGTFFADVTGDGLADGIALNGNTMTVRRAGIADSDSTVCYSACSYEASPAVNIASALETLTGSPPWSITLSSSTLPPGSPFFRIRLDIARANLGPTQTRIALRLGQPGVPPKALRVGPNPCYRVNAIRVRKFDSWAVMGVRRSCNTRTLVFGTFDQSNPLFGRFVDVLYLDPPDRMWDLFAGKSVTVTWY